MSGTRAGYNAGFRACRCTTNNHRWDRFGECFICNETGVKCVNDYKELQPGYFWFWDEYNKEAKGQYVAFAGNLDKENFEYNHSTTKYNSSLGLPRAYPCPNPGELILLYISPFGDEV